MKIWTKIINGEKIKKDNVYPLNKLDIDSIYNNLESICLTLDEPLPIVLDKHIRHLNQFNCTTFLPSDFIEDVEFTKMVVEIFDDTPKK